MHPPHQPKPNEPGRKFTTNFGVDLFFWRRPNFGRKERLNFRFRPKNHSQFWWRPFFFFFFFWRPPNFGRKRRLNFRFRPKNHSQFRWRHPNIWGFVLKIPPHQNFLDPPLLETKRYPSKKFLETLSFVFPAKTTVVLAGKTKLRVSKNFFGGYLFAFIEYLCNCSLKIKTKNIKNYSSILAIVNHRNWLDNSPPLSGWPCADR